MFGIYYLVDQGFTLMNGFCLIIDYPRGNPSVPYTLFLLYVSEYLPHEADCQPVLKHKVATCTQFSSHWLALSQYTCIYRTSACARSLRHLHSVKHKYTLLSHLLTHNTLHLSSAYYSCSYPLYLKQWTF